MNRLPGNILAVETQGSIALVDVAVGERRFTATLVGMGEEVAAWQPGLSVTLLFKETEVSLAKNLSGAISMRNRMPVRITGIAQGKLLSSVLLELDGHRLESVITTRSVHALALQPGDVVEALVKANEMTVVPHEP